MRRWFRLLRRKWRRTAGIPLPLAVVGCVVMERHQGAGLLIQAAAMLWVTTIPCGLDCVNRDKGLWWVRQLWFGTLAYALLRASWRHW